jgi:hypothetical protein
MSSAPATTAAGTRQGFELADVLRAFGPAYCRVHPPSLEQQRVIGDILACRTAALGGHREHCPRCGFERFAYHSCRNRHCPKCQSLVRAQWLEARKAELLPVPYFHLVFTLPHALNPLLLANRRAMLNLLFAAAAQTLLEFGQRNLGGKVGFSMILHTWDQKLNAHYHLHCLIAGGALAEDHSRWIDSGDRFLFPVHALSVVFRGKFLDGLRQKLAELRIPNGVAPSKLIGRLRKTPWVVYAKRPFAGPEKVLDYLGRYTHRVAIANSRLIDIRDHHVVFGYRDRRRGDVPAVTSLTGQEFIRRFLLHILPKGFMRIRHFGFLANRAKRQNLQRCRELLDHPRPAAPTDPPETTEQRLLRLTGVDVTRCPNCAHQPLLRTKLTAPGPRANLLPFEPEALDSS